MDLCSAPGSVGETLGAQLGEACSVIQDGAVRESSDRACRPEAGCGQEEGERGERHAIDPRRMRMLTKCYERIHRKAEKTQSADGEPYRRQRRATPGLPYRCPCGDHDGLGGRGVLVD